MRHLLLLSIVPTALTAATTTSRESCRQALVATTGSCNGLEQSCLCPAYDEAAEILTSCAVSRALTFEEASNELQWLAKHCGRSLDIQRVEPGLRKRGLRRGVFGSLLSGLGSMFGYSPPAATTQNDDQPNPTDDSNQSPPPVITPTTQALTATRVPPTTTAQPRQTSGASQRISSTETSERAKTRTPTNLVTLTVTPTPQSTSATSTANSALVTPSGATSSVTGTTSAANASQDPSATAAPTASKTSKKLPGAAIAAIVIVTLLAVGGIIWLAFMCIRRAKRERQQQRQIEEDLQNDSLLYPEPKLPTVYGGSGSTEGVSAASAAVGTVGGAAALGAGARHSHNHSGDSADSMGEIRNAPPVRQSFEGGPESPFDQRRSHGSFPGGPAGAMAMNNPARPPPAAWGQDSRNLHHLTYSQQGDSYGYPRGPGMQPHRGPYGTGPSNNRPPYPTGPNSGGYVPYRPPQGYGNGPSRRSMGPGPGPGPGSAGYRPVPPPARGPAPGGLNRQLPASLIAGSAQYSSSQNQSRNAPPPPPQQKPRIDPLLMDADEHQEPIDGATERPVLKVVNRTPTPGSSPAIGIDSANNASVATVVKASTPTVVTVTRSSSTRSSIGPSPPLTNGSKEQQKSPSATIHGIRRKEIGSNSTIPE